MKLNNTKVLKIQMYYFKLKVLANNTNVFLRERGELNDKE